VQTVGAQRGDARGAGLLVDSVIKSGGNDFHGTAVLYGSGPNLESNNIDDTLKGGRHQGWPKMHTMQDVAGTFGGRPGSEQALVFRRRAGMRRSHARSWTRSIPTATPILNVKKGTYHFEKLSYQASTGNRLTGFAHWTNDYELRNASRFVPRESMEEKDNPVWIAKGEWQAVRRQRAGRLGPVRAMELQRPRL